MGGPDQAAIGRVTPDAPDAMSFAAGAMGPKTTAACDFARAGGAVAGIEGLPDARVIVEDRAGMQVRMDPVGVESHRCCEKMSPQRSQNQSEARRGRA